MPELLRRAAAASSGLRVILAATLGAAGIGTPRQQKHTGAARARVRNAQVNDRLDRLEL